MTSHCFIPWNFDELTFCCVSKSVCFVLVLVAHTPTRELLWHKKHPFLKQKNLQMNVRALCFCLVFLHTYSFLLERLWHSHILVFLWFVPMVVFLNVHPHLQPFLVFHLRLLRSFQAFVGLQHLSFIVSLTGSLWLAPSAVWLTITHLLARSWLLCFNDSLLVLEDFWTVLLPISDWMKDICLLFAAAWNSLRSFWLCYKKLQGMVSVWFWISSYVM